jgi:hypothetical protein
MGAHVGDIGTPIVFDTGEDLTLATVHKLIYRKPNGTTGEWEGIIDGTKLMFVTTLITDLDQAGTWDVDAYIEIPGWKGHSDIDHFDVSRNII